MTKRIKWYVGWIAGKSTMRRYLRQCGVRGKMEFLADKLPYFADSHFQHCVCSSVVLHKLEKELPGFYRNAFSELPRAYLDLFKQYEGLRLYDD
jgi:hypothetical protein